MEASAKDMALLLEATEATVPLLNLLPATDAATAVGVITSADVGRARFPGEAFSWSPSGSSERRLRVPGAPGTVACCCCCCCFKGCLALLLLPPPLFLLFLPVVTGVSWMVKATGLGTGFFVASGCLPARD